MPRLHTYTAEVPESAAVGYQRASASDLSPAGAVGDLAGTVMAGADKILTTVENSEQRKVMVRNAETRAKYEKRLQEATLNGEDLDKIREDFSNEQAKVYDELQTRKGRETADYYTTESGRLFEEKVAGVQVHRAVAEAKLDGSKFIMSLSSLLNANPSYLPQAERDIDNFVATLTRVPVEGRNEIAANMKNNANVMSAMSRARSDPKGTIAAVNAGAYSLSGPQIEQVINEAQRTISMQRTDAEYQYQLQQRERKDLDDAGRGDHLKSIFAGTYDANKAIADPRLTPQTLEHIQVFAKSWAREQAEGAKRSDPVVLRDLWLGIHAPEGDPRRQATIFPIVKAVEEGKVSASDGNMLVQLVEQQKDENARTLSSKVFSTVEIFQNALRANVKYQVGDGPQQLANIVMQYQADIYRQISKVRNEQNGNPHALFDPTNKDYVGSSTFTQGSIMAAAANAKAIRDSSTPNEMTLKSGKKIRWTGKGDKEDMDTWEEVK